MAVAALVAVAVGCGNRQDDLANGKRLFTGDVAADYKKEHPRYQACGGCHALSRADSAGGQGPSLDQAFAQARADGMTSQTVQGVVHDQINSPRRGSIMQSDIVSGADASDVAAYVASVAARPGKDQGELATIPAVKDSGPIGEKDGTLTIPANEQGRTLFASTMATASAGEVSLVMPNRSPLQHNIAIKGAGAGPIVGTGGTSRVTANLKPGKYEYYCTVPGHEAGGMKGTLTVK